MKVRSGLDFWILFQEHETDAVVYDLLVMEGSVDRGHRDRRSPERADCHTRFARNRLGIFGNSCVQAPRSFPAYRVDGAWEWF